MEIGIVSEGAEGKVRGNDARIRTSGRTGGTDGSKTTDSGSGSCIVDLQWPRLKPTDRQGTAHRGPASGSCHNETAPRHAAVGGPGLDRAAPAGRAGFNGTRKVESEGAAEGAGFRRAGATVTSRQR